MGWSRSYDTNGNSRVQVQAFEEEFLAHILLPDGKTVGTWIAPQLARAYETQRMPPMLLEAPKGAEPKDDGVVDGEFVE